MKLKKGCLHIYTGDGKGKTTAALGLALRAVGAGMKVFIVQFLKGKASSEFTPLAKFSDFITFVQYGRDCLIKDKPTEEDRDLGLRGLNQACEAIVSGKYDLVILDEANVAVWFGLLSVDDFLDLIKKNPLMSN